MEPTIDPLTGGLIFKPIYEQSVQPLKELVTRIESQPTLNPKFNP